MKKQLKYSVLGLTIGIVIFCVTYLIIAYGISLHIPTLPYSTIILDKDNHEIGEIIRDKTIRHQSLTYEELPEFYRSALVTLEDKSFWSNNGINVRGLARSVWNNLLAGKVVEGGSTLSTGLIRNTLWLNEKRSIGKKLLEFIYAIRLNHQMTKEEILTEYANRIYYGYLNYGLASASRYYFAKSPNNLTKAEQIALIILPKDPKKYNPYKENKAFRIRFSLVVDTLAKNNILSSDEAKSILSEDLSLNYSHDDMLPYVTDFMERGYQKWRLQNQTLSSSGSTGGSRENNPRFPPSREGQSESMDSQAIILTTIDTALTEKIDTLARNTILDLSWKDVSDYGIIILDRETNELRTMIGGVNYHASEGQVNSTLALRQPGSTIKPFTYTLAFEKLGMDPASLILDLPTSYKTSEGYEYNPKNYSLDYKGQITVAEALSQSINIPAVKTADRVGVDTLLRFLHTAGFSSLTKDADHYGLGLTLGNGEVSLYELTRAYSIFAHEGKLCDISIISDTKNKTCQQIATPKAISDINLILTNRYFKLGGFPVHSSLDFEDRNVFVKTGTSRNFRDNWAVGYTDHYIIGVWTGNKSGAFMKGVSGATGAGEIFSRIVYTLEPNSIEQRPIELDKSEQKYLEIIAPLTGSIFTINPLKPLENQRIRAISKTNIDYDIATWLLDGKKLEGDSILPTLGNHILKCILMKDGEIIKEVQNTFEIQSGLE